MGENISRQLRFEVFLASICFGLGILAPAIRIAPPQGNLTGLIAMLSDAGNTPRHYSILSSILSLLEDGEYFITIIVFLFSVAFPFWKLGVLWDSILSLGRNFSLTAELGFIERLGKFSMLDVYVLALVTVAIKGLPGGTSVELCWGLIFFVLSVFFSMHIISKLKQYSSLPHG